MAKKTKALILGGGAPNLTLMSGALLALEQRGVTFDVVLMAGAGAVVGLVYLAPKYLSREDALKDTVNFGVSDVIYSMFPVNYKTFSKGGGLARRFRNYWSQVPAFRAATYQYHMTPAQKLQADWLLFWEAMMCPTDVNYYSEGLCAHAPFIDSIVDFSKLRKIQEHCYLNAYCIEDEETVSFKKHDIDVDHFRASLSFPFLYPPYRIDGKHYYEGAAADPLNLESLMEEHGIDTFVLFDVLTKELVHRPRNLWDAYAQSIIVPLVASANRELDMLVHWAHTGYWIEDAVNKPPPTAPPKKQADALVVKFDIPQDQLPYLLEWSRSNLERLFDVGQQAGEAFWQAHKAKLQ